MLLQQHRTRIRSLKSQWTNPMASSIRFDSHLHMAIHIATSVAAVTGVQPSSPTGNPLTWLEPYTTDHQHHGICNDLDDEAENTSTELRLSEPDDGIDDIATLLGDFVVEDTEDSPTFEPPSPATSQPPSSTPAIHLRWELPVCGRLFVGFD